MTPNQSPGAVERLEAALKQIEPYEPIRDDTEIVFNLSLTYDEAKTLLSTLKARPSREEVARIASLLQLIVDAGGTVDSSDDPSSPVAPYCDPTAETDLFNLLHEPMLRTFHDSISEGSTTHITKAGRQFLALFSPTSEAGGEDNRSSRDHARSIGAALDWQPVATAPTEGRAFLVCTERKNVYVVIRREDEGDRFLLFGSGPARYLSEEVWGWAPTPEPLSSAKPADGESSRDELKPNPASPLEGVVEALRGLVGPLREIIECDDDAIAAKGKPGANLNGYGLVDLFDSVGHPFGSGKHKQQPYRSNNLDVALTDARAALAALANLSAAGVGEGDWPISKDGPHQIGDHRRWLARQFMDSRLSDAEAFNIVAWHPSIKDQWARSSEGEVERLREAEDCQLCDSARRCTYACENSPSGAATGGEG